MSSDKDILDPEAIARLLSALSHPLRVRILQSLLQTERCVSDFVDVLDADQPKVSQHLKILRESGLIACRAEGRRRCYALRQPDFVRHVLETADRIAAGGPEEPDPDCAS